MNTIWFEQRSCEMGQIKCIIFIKINLTVKMEVYGNMKHISNSIFSDSFWSAIQGLWYCDYVMTVFLEKKS